GNGKIVVIVVMVVGIIAVVYGIFMIVKNAKKPSDDYSQYNRINEDEINQSKREEVENNTEEKQEYVFHFTGKLNQSYVMKDRYDNEVFKADCEGITIVKATDFNFVNVRTGSSKARKIGHTVTSSIGGDASIFANISSSFKIDGENCWDFLKNMGYGFNFSLNGLKSHYEVYHQGVNVGSIEIAGTEVMNKKYEGNALAKLPTNGIFRISCQPSEVEGFFYICFCITKTEPTID
ncbi:MAG: hypothetical protein MJ236_00620, partial [Clostridia bacterium]|nr:hypothetical protein [Clostridia bacterium]